MSIQHLASGSSNGIMNFLFHDDGSGTEDGMVLEGTEFSKTLHQLLGEFETEGAATATASVSDQAEATETTVADGKLVPEAKASIATLQAGVPAHADGKVPQLEVKTPAQVLPPVQPQAASIPAHPLSAELDTLAADFTLPLHHAALADDASWQNDAEGVDLDEAFWRIPGGATAAPSITTHTAVAANTPVIDVGADLAQAALTVKTGRAVGTTGGTGVEAANTADAANPAPRPDKDEVPPSFSRGINHLIELVREATQASPQPGAQTVLQQGGNPAPASGKTLPPELRSAAPTHAKPDDIQPRAVLSPEFFQLPANPRQQAMTSTDELPATTVRTDGRVMQLPSARKPQQSFRAGFTAAQRTPSTEADPRSAAGSPTQSFDVSERLLPEAVPVDAQSVAANTSASNVQTHGMHSQTTLSALHALTPKTSAPDSGTTFANPQLYSPHPMGSDAWMQDLGTRVEWLKDMNVSTADLRLHPAELGTLEIRIMTDNDNTTVSFITHNSAARDIIESSLPQLRELLASQGMQLGQSQVSHQSAEGQRRGHDANLAQSMLQRNNGSAEDVPLPPRRVSYVADPGRIDHYV